MNQLTQRELKERQEQRDYGWRLFEAGQSEKLCTNDFQRAGYRSALNACAYGEGMAHLVRVGEMR